MVAELRLSMAIPAHCTFYAFDQVETIALRRTSLTIMNHLPALSWN